MSLIEKAAELLASRGPQPQRQSSGRPEQRVGGGSVLERAAGTSSPSGQGGNAVLARQVQAEARTFKVDRARLREQNLITPDGGRTPIAESFRRIKRQVLANIASPKPDSPPANLVMVTSALPGEGKSYCSINLAISMALEMDRTVLLVDADVARASIPRAFGLQAEKGLMDLLTNPEVPLADLLWRTDIGRLSLLPSGAAHNYATELLASDTMHSLLRDVAERYSDRVIIFDSPPLLAASEGGALASQMGQIIVVVEAGETSEATLKDALGRLDTTGIVGLLLNKVEGPVSEYRYGAYG